MIVEQSQICFIIAARRLLSMSLTLRLAVSIRKNVICSLSKVTFAQSRKSESYFCALIL